jgi:hypothetical protein
MENVSLGFQVRAQIQEVEKLAVVGNPNVAVLVAHRLMAALREVEDAQTVEAKGTFKAWLIS